MRAAGGNKVRPRDERVTAVAHCKQLEMTGGDTGKETGWPNPRAQRRKGRGLWGTGWRPGMPLGFRIGMKSQPLTAAHLPTPGI